MNAKASATKVCPGCSARYPPDALFCPNDGTPLTANAYIDAGYEHARALDGGGDPHDSYLGREISGHIEIRNLAGVGAMGRVYRAFQRGIDRDVAVKVLHRELSANQQLVARFHREAKVASRLQHPNVVQVHLAGQLPDGAMYIVMEYLDGLSLQSALAASPGPFPLERALHVALQICDAAGEAHSQGVVHRDIKPENVMLIRRGDDSDFVKVLDFGIARLNWGEQSMATAAGLIFGTARYISPEGAQGEAVGPEGDVYATATLLYQMLAGRTPFEGDQAVALLVAQIHDSPPPLLSLPGTSHIPEPIAAVIMKNLAKSPADRAPDARTFGRALVEAAKSAGLSPEDLVPRSSLFVPPARMSDPGGLPVLAGSSPSLPAFSLSPAPPPGPPPAPPRAPALPLGITAGPSLPGRRSEPDAQRSSPPPGISPKTQLWVPPIASAPTPAPRTSLTGPVAVVGSFPPPAPAAQETPARAPQPSSVDRTLDEVQPPPPGDASGSRIRTEPALLLPVGLNLSPPTPPAHLEPSRVPPPVTSAAPATTERPPQLPPQLPSQAAGLPAPRDASGPRKVLTPPPERVPTKRLAGIIFICLLFGGMIGTVVCYRLGWFETAGTLDETVSHAEEAMRHGRWDSPTGDNVRDITNEALTKWPRESRILDVRSHATKELVELAVGRKYAGDLPEALHLAHLAKELDPTDTTAQQLVDEYERSGIKKTLDAASGPASPTSATPATGASRTHPMGPSAPKVAMDVSLPHPHVGQPVTFTAKVLGATGPAKSVEDARFLLSGPRLTPDTKLGALLGAPGSYTATFTGFEPGKYEVAFDAKVDGSLVHTTRVMVIDSDTPPGPSGPAPTLPPSIPSAKWM